MNSHRISLKLYMKDGSAPQPGALIEAWHGWIKDQVLGELLIDVTDYHHVHEGPAVLLVGHESDYALDLDEGRPGLFYQRKRAPDVAPAERLPDSLRRLFRAALRLEGDAKLAVRFRTSELLVRVLDRLKAPNTKETWEREKAELVATFEKVFGDDCEISWEQGDAREPFTVRVRTGRELPLRDLAARA